MLRLRVAQILDFNEHAGVLTYAVADSSRNSLALCSALVLLPVGVLDLDASRCLSAEAGCSLRELTAFLDQRGFSLPFDATGLRAAR